MTDFKRKLFTADDVRSIGNISPTARARGAISKQIDAIQILNIVRGTLGKDVASIFLKESSDVLLRTAETILLDHLNSQDVRPKDLQLNLVVNCVVQFVRAKNLPKANRYLYGENILRQCGFDDNFKYSLKVALFDNKAMELPWHVISPWIDSPIVDPGNWTTDKSA